MANKTFRNSINGYNRDEVNKFIAELSRTYKKSQDENKALIEKQQSEIDGLSTQLDFLQKGVATSEVDTTSIAEQLDCCNKQLGEAVDMIDTCQSQLEEKECVISKLQALCDKQKEIIQAQEEKIAAFEKDGVDSMATETTALDIACRAAAIAVQNLEEKHLQTNTVVRDTLVELSDMLDEGHQTARQQILALIEEFSVE